jgi:hypothetical protein
MLPKKTTAKNEEREPGIHEARLADIIDSFLESKRNQQY